MDTTELPPQEDSLTKSPKTSSTSKLTPRDIVLQKKEAKKTADEQNLTFQPKFFTKNTGLANKKSDGSSRFDQLYSDAVKRQEEEMAKAPAAVGERLYDAAMVTLSKRGTDPAPPSFQPHFYTSTNKRVQSPLEVGDRLYDAAMVTLSKRGVDPNAAPTFQPAISKRASSTERRRDVPIGDQLYTKAQQLQEKKKRLKAEADDRIKEQLPFEPKYFTSRRPSTSPADASTIAERSLKLEREKQKRIDEAKRLKIQAELEDATFSPDIAPARRRATPTRTGNLFERLSASVEKEKSLPPEFTFHPNIGAYPVDRHEDGKGIHDRLFREAELKRKQMEQEIELAKAAEAQALTFKPQIPTLPCSDAAYTSADEKSVVDEPSTKSPMTAAVFQRLSVSDKQQMQNVWSQLKRDLEMSQCTFKPQIPEAPSPSSQRAQNSTTPIHERLNAEAATLRVESKKREERRKQLEAAALQPKPQIDPHSVEIAASLSRRTSFTSHTQGSLSRSSTPTDRGASGTSVSSSITSLDTSLGHSQNRPKWGFYAGSKLKRTSEPPRKNKNGGASHSNTKNVSSPGDGSVNTSAAASPGKSFTHTLPPPPSVAELAAVLSNLKATSAEERSTPKIIRGLKKTTSFNGATAETDAQLFSASELEDLRSAIDEANAITSPQAGPLGSKNLSVATNRIFSHSKDREKDSDDDTSDKQERVASPSASSSAERKKGRQVRLGSGGRDLPPVEVPVDLAPDEKIGLRWGCDPDDVLKRDVSKDRSQEQHMSI